ncbi:MAG: hypothetical protein NTY68_01570 [Candidatus Micrarchaeota archaeon]|nr:hypothetical protein [Candidatus Micrarchaeota archaeon]
MAKTKEELRKKFDLQYGEIANAPISEERRKEIEEKAKVNVAKANKDASLKDIPENKEAQKASNRDNYFEKKDVMGFVEKAWTWKGGENSISLGFPSVSFQFDREPISPPKRVDNNEKNDDQTYVVNLGKGMIAVINIATEGKNMTLKMLSTANKEIQTLTISSSKKMSKDPNVPNSTELSYSGEVRIGKDPTIKNAKENLNPPFKSIAVETSTGGSRINFWSAKEGKRIQDALAQIRGDKTFDDKGRKIPEVVRALNDIREASLIREQQAIASRSIPAKKKIDLEEKKVAEALPKKEKKSSWWKTKN